jgi:hypothetical protein
MDSLHKMPELVRRIDHITAVALADLEKTDKPAVVLDVRSERVVGRAYPGASIFR